MPPSTPNPLSAKPPIHHSPIASIPCARHGPTTGPVALIFSHGFEAGMDDAMTRDFAQGFASYPTTTAPIPTTGTSAVTGAIVCWDGTRDLETRIAHFQRLHAHPTYARAATGGRSMGARAAVRAALARGEVSKHTKESEGEKEGEVLVLVSWPFLAGKNGERREPERREQILLDLPRETEVLFVAGTADAQCPGDMLEEFREKMRAKTWVVEVVGANHRMEIGEGERVDGEVRGMTGRVAAEWLRDREEGRRKGRVEWDAEEDKLVWSGWGEG